MFEAEVAMEKRSSILPLILMMCLLALIVGTVVYVFMQVRERRPLTAQQVTPIVAAALQGPGPAVIRFRTGSVKLGDDGKPDPNYRLLEKAGVVKLAKPAKGNVQVSITPEGESMLAAIQGLNKSKEEDGSVSYRVPLAQRQFVGITDVEMNGANGATVQYTWKWLPNPLGDVFDAGGPLVKGFTLWERQTLINKYEVDFYHGDAARSTLALVRNGREWTIPAR